MRKPDSDYLRGWFDAIYGEPWKPGETVMYYYGYENGRIDDAEEKAEDARVEVDIRETAGHFEG